MIVAGQLMEMTEPDKSDTGYGVHVFAIWNVIIAGVLYGLLHLAVWLWGVFSAWLGTI